MERLNLMEIQDQTPNGNGEEPKTPDGTAGSGEPAKNPPEGYISKEQFVASQNEAIRLKKELDALKNPPSNGNLPEEKKKVFEYLSEYEKQKVEEAKKEENEIKSNLDKLHSIHGDFDDTKLKAIIAEYGVYAEDGNINWEKGIELYKKLGNSVVKKTTVAGARTQDNPLEADKVEVKGKGFHDLVQEGLKKFGIGK